MLKLQGIIIGFNSYWGARIRYQLREKELALMYSDQGQRRHYGDWFSKYPMGQMGQVKVSVQGWEK